MNAVAPGWIASSGLDRYPLPPRGTTQAFDGFHLATKPKVLE